MTAEQMLIQWAGKKLDIDPALIERVEFDTTDAYHSEAGTYWPAETTATVHLFRQDGKRGGKRPEIYVDNYNMTAFIQEILDAARNAEMARPQRS